MVLRGWWYDNLYSDFSLFWSSPGKISAWLKFLQPTAQQVSRCPWSLSVLLDPFGKQEVLDFYFLARDLDNLSMNWCFFIHFKISLGLQKLTINSHIASPVGSLKAPCLREDPRAGFWAAGGLPHGPVQPAVHGVGPAEEGRGAGGDPAPLLPGGQLAGTVD